MSAAPQKLQYNSSSGDSALSTFLSFFFAGHRKVFKYGEKFLKKVVLAWYLVSVSL
jgi:hypothetical protein